MKNKLMKKEVMQLIKKARKAARNGGKEIAGLLVHNGYSMEILETRNVSNKGGHFRFDEKQIKTIEKAVKELGHEIVGTFHSHPAYYAKPSDTDIKWAVDDSLMLIVDCIDREARLWRIRGGKAREVNIHMIQV